MSAKRLRTTVSLSADLLDAVDALVQSGAADSRNDFLDKALRTQLAASRRAAIDAEFAPLAGDRGCQDEAERVAGEFVEADWEAPQVGERFHETR